MACTCERRGRGRLLARSTIAAPFSKPVDPASCREVCGFPRVVHGGLTASIMDETFGFLLFALKQHRQLPFWGPAYTAHLEVS